MCCLAGEDPLCLVKSCAGWLWRRPTVWSEVMCWGCGGGPQSTLWSVQNSSVPHSELQPLILNPSLETLGPERRTAAMGDWGRPSPHSTVATLDPHTGAQRTPSLLVLEACSYTHAWVFKPVPNQLDNAPQRDVAPGEIWKCLERVLIGMAFYVKEASRRQTPGEHLNTLFCETRSAVQRMGSTKPALEVPFCVPLCQQFSTCGVQPLGSKTILSEGHVANIYIVIHNSHKITIIK